MPKKEEGLLKAGFAREHDRNYNTKELNILPKY